MEKTANKCAASSDSSTVLSSEGQISDALRNAHYMAMLGLGYTDDEIERDWKQFCKEYNEYIDMLHEVRGDYSPFGSSIKPSKMIDEPTPW